MTTTTHKLKLMLHKISGRSSYLLSSPLRVTTSKRHINNFIYDSNNISKDHLGYHSNDILIF